MQCRRGIISGNERIWASVKTAFENASMKLIDSAAKGWRGDRFSICSKWDFHPLDECGIRTSTLKSSPHTHRSSPATRCIRDGLLLATTYRCGYLDSHPRL